MRAIVTIPASIAARLWTCGKNIVEIHINRQYTFTKSWNTHLQNNLWTLSESVSGYECLVNSIWPTSLHARSIGWGTWLVLDNQLYFKITMKLISVVLTRFMSSVFMSTQLCQQELFQNLKIMMRLISYRCTSCQQEWCQNLKNSYRCTDRRPGRRLTHTLFGRFVTEERRYHLLFLSEEREALKESAKLFGDVF